MQLEWEWLRDRWPGDGRPHGECCWQQDGSLGMAVPAVSPAVLDKLGLLSSGQNR